MSASASGTSWELSQAYSSDDFQPSGDHWTRYEWLVVCGAIFAFLRLGVGAKTLTLWQACMIASVFEFTGAVALGGQVAQTVAGSITSPTYFKNVPEVFAFGMLCALMASWIWVTLATYLEFAISTTHAVIGAIIGFGLVYGGKDAIVWNRSTDSFPYREGLTTVVIAWFTSPVLSGLLGGVMLFLNRTLILRRSNSTVVAMYALVPLVIITVFINAFFVLYKGASAELQWSAGKAAWVAVCIACGAGLFAIPLIISLRRYFLNQDQSMMNPAQQPEPELAVSSKDWAPPQEEGTVLGRIKTAMTYSLTVDIHEEVHKNARVAALHSAAEVFDPRTEHVYKYLQVFSACCVSFAHGANDTANAIGPFAGIWYVYNNHAVSPTAETPKWILALGGVGLVCGLATYGYNIIKVLGVKMAKITPSRGYCAELAVSLTVAVASVYGLPISTTHCIVGAEIGVGLLEGVREGTNWLLFLRTAVAWVMTLIVSGTISAGIFSFGTHSPDTAVLGDIAAYQSLVYQTVSNQVATLNATNHANAAKFGRFNTTQADVNVVQNLLRYSTALYLSGTMPVVGFNKSAAFNSSQQIVVPAPVL